MEKPFFEFNVTDIRDNQVEELKKFHKSYFDVSNIQNTASELKYMGELKSLITIEFQNPSEGLVKHFARQLYQGMLTAKLMEQFSGLTKRSLQQYINDLITERLKSALQKENTTGEQQEQIETPTPVSKIETTQEEIEGFLLVKTILRQKLQPARIGYRDAQSYFSVLLDDNNRRTVCRLYLNGSKRYIGTFDAQKKETRHEILSIDDIFRYADSLLKTAASYEAGKADNDKAEDTEKVKDNEV